jgi:rare lipoprotein A
MSVFDSRTLRSRLCRTAGVVLIGVISLCAPASALTPPLASTSGTEQGIAAYYGRHLNWRRTASGERYNPNALTAAHNTLPFGTRVRITNAKNNRSVVVRI